jgi:hypothetical protein
MVFRMLFAHDAVGREVSVNGASEDRLPGNVKNRHMRRIKLVAVWDRAAEEGGLGNNSQLHARADGIHHHLDFALEFAELSHDIQ